MPAPQTNNGNVTSTGCSGSIYIFPGQALQCTRNYAEGKNCCSRGKFLLGGDSCSSSSQILAKAIIYDNQYSPTVPVYSGSGDMNTAPITSCSQSAIANGCGQQGEAIYLGDYCSLKLPLVGTCLAKTYVFCKFQGLLATIIQAQGRAQLAGGQNPMSWGSVQSPNCSGFTPTQFQELNFSNMNLSEYIAVIKNQVSNTLTTPAIDNQIQQTTKSIGNEINQLETGGALTGTTP
jgi:conjugal transfer mating pair stabilization protein TraN